MNDLRRMLITLPLHFVVIALIGPLSFSQTPQSYMVLYGPNYSTADRKSTIPASWVTPFSFVYRPVCQLSLAVDDDPLSAYKGTTTWAVGTGNLGFEGHFTPTRLGGGFDSKNAICIAAEHQSVTFDYIATVPVPSTVESDQLAHLAKATYNLPLSKGNFLLTAGASLSGTASGTEAANAVLSANYQRYLDTSGLWSSEFEVDLASSSSLSPSSVAALLAFDWSSKDQKWLLRFGSSFGVTPYSPKVSPFATVIFSGQIRPPKKLHQSSILKY